jgi:hypothetical protein
LIKCVRQAREAFHAHTHREVLALDVRRADVVGVGIADNRCLLCANAFWRTVLTLFNTPAARRVAIDLHELREINIRPAERGFNGDEIMLEPVGRELNPIGKPPLKVVNEGVCPAANELGIGIERRPSPNVSGAFRRRLGVDDVLVLRVDKAPDFVALNTLGRVPIVSC